VPLPVGVPFRPARLEDAEAIARIHNQGIADRVATFQIDDRRAPQVAREIEDGRVILVAETDGRVTGWAGLAPYDPGHRYYATVAEATIYVERGVRGSGIGRSLLDGLADEAERRGLHKLVGKLFTSNDPSIALVEACGWRRVGVHRRHGRLDGEWKDVLVVELLIGDALEPS
jgi:L-amino acid N-acyltransferase YncA